MQLLVLYLLQQAPGRGRAQSYLQYVQTLFISFLDMTEKGSLKIQ